MQYSGVGLIVENQEGKYLLHLRDGNTPRSPNQWSLIGGTIEEGEDPLACAVREVKEETNLTFKEPKLLGDFEFYGKTIALIKGEVDTQHEQLVLGEGTKFEFFSADQARQLLASLTYTNPHLDEFARFLDHS